MDKLRIQNDSFAQNFACDFNFSLDLEVHNLKIEIDSFAKNFINLGACDF